MVTLVDPSAVFGLDRQDGLSFPTNFYDDTFLSLLRRARTRINLESVLEESARANPDARIRPLTHVSVDRAFQAKSVGSNSLVTILIAIRCSPNL